MEVSSSAGAATGAGSTAAGAMGVSAFARGSVVGQGPLLNVPRAAAGVDSADGAAAPADAAGGCVALWSLKNQFFPVWSFTTKAGVWGEAKNKHQLWGRLSSS